MRLDMHMSNGGEVWRKRELTWSLREAAWSAVTSVLSAGLILAQALDHVSLFNSVVFPVAGSLSLILFSTNVLWHKLCLKLSLYQCLITDNHFPEWRNICYFSCSWLPSHCPFHCVWCPYLCLLSQITTFTQVALLNQGTLAASAVTGFKLCMESLSPAALISDKHFHCIDFSCRDTCAISWMCFASHCVPAPYKRQSETVI